MEVIKLEKYERQFLKSESRNDRRELARLTNQKSENSKTSKDVAAPAKQDRNKDQKAQNSKVKGRQNESMNSFDPRNEPSRDQPGRVRGRERDDSGNLLLDLVLAGAVNKEH